MMRRPAAALCVFAVAIAVSAPAFADDTGAADALYADAKTLAEAGNWSAACPKFEASLEASRTLGTLLNLADCLEQEKKLARALERWDEAIALAKEKNDERVKFATERKAAIEPRVPTLVLDVKQGPDKLGVSVGKRNVEADRFGLPLRVDPGKVPIVVSRDDQVLETTEIDLAEGETKRHPLDLAAIAKAHPGKKGVVMVPANPAQRYAGIVTLSVGLAGLATFGIMEAVALGQRAAADGEGGCVEKGETTVCSPQGYELAQSAGDIAEIGQWIGVGGLAVAALGLTLFLTAPSDQPQEQPSAAILPLVLPGGGGIAIGGRF
jgi:hypothetical protein